MKRIELDVFSETPNAAVVKMSGRKFPGLVLQGDTLHNLLQQSQAIHQRSKTHDDEELVAESASLVDVLRELESHYVGVLKSHRLALPFPE